MLNDMEFTREISRLKSTFGEKIYPVTQLERILNYVKLLEPNEWHRVVNDMIDTKKYAPTPAEFKDSVSIVLRSRPAHMQPSQAAYQNQCKDCGDIGYCWLDVDGSKQWAFCYCKAGADTEKSSKVTLPKIESRYRTPFPILQFPYDWFKPKNLDDINYRSIMKMGEDFKKELQYSSEFWANYAKGKED